MNNIAQMQNDPGFLRMINAQKQLYTEAKQSMVKRLWVSVLLALFPLAMYILPFLETFEWFVAGIALLITILFTALKNIETKKVALAAAIQEQHDVELFDIKWNESIAGNKALTEDIVAADRRFKGERKIDWYEGVPATLSSEEAAIFCQKQNLSWDTRMREDYSKIFIVLFGGILLIPLFGAAYFGIKVSEYMIKVLAPTIPLLYLCFENLQTHKARAEKQEIKAEELEMLLQNKVKITPAMIRKNQDKIFKFRCESALIPDWYADYWREKNKR